MEVTDIPNIPLLWCAALDRTRNVMRLAPMTWGIEKRMLFLSEERTNTTLLLLEAVWKQSLYKIRSYVICRARLRTDLLDNRSLAMLLEISKRLIY